MDAFLLCKGRCRMFKDYHKYLSTSLKVYLFVLVIIFIMKIVGLDYFGLDINNPMLINISKAVESNWWLKDSINLITLAIQFYFYLCLVCKKKHLYFSAFMGALLNLELQIILVVYFQMDWIYSILSIIIMIIIPMIVNHKIFIKRQLCFIALITLYQLISYFVRDIGVNSNYNNFLIDSLLNFDQLLLLAITYNIVFMKGDVKECQEQVVGFSSLKKINLKKSLLKLRKNFQNNKIEFKKKSKEEKITVILFIIFSSIWNLLTVVLVLLVAFLNDTLIECLFILTSFWLSKSSFGKPFHFDSMLKCFIVSNLSYYLLNKITTPLDISILVPIMLGVGLSYVTSKFVKKTYKPLYRGMDESLFEETILKVEEKDSIKYKICYEFYIEKVSDLSLSFKYNYSVPGIRKIRDRINQKIKKLN